MIDPKENPSFDEKTAERKPELEPEKLKDLTPEEQADGVRGGVTTPAVQCEAGTA